MIIIHHFPFDMNSSVIVEKDNKYLHESIPSDLREFPEAIYRLSLNHKDNQFKIYGARDILQEAITQINSKYSNNNLQIEVIEA